MKERLQIPKITPEKVKLYKGDICAFLEEQYVIIPPSGTPRLFNVEPWLREILTTIFHTYDEQGKRLYTKAVIGLPRKNYKSATLSGCAIWSMLFDVPSGARVFSAAGSSEQAGIIFTEASKAIGRNPTFKEIFHTPRVKHRIMTPITIPGKDAEYKVVSSDAPMSHGLNATMIFFDELHVQKNYQLWEAFLTGMGIRYGTESIQNPLLISITTAGYDLYMNDGKTKTLAYDEFVNGITTKYQRNIINNNNFTIDPLDMGHLSDHDKLIFDRCQAGNEDARKFIEKEVAAKTGDYFFWSYTNLASVTSQKYLDAQKIRLKSSREYQIFHENKWVGGTGLLLSDQQINAVFDRVGQNQEDCGNMENTYYVGVDIGPKLDRSAVAVVHVEYGTEILVVDNMRTWIDSKKKLKEIEEWVDEVCALFGVNHLAGKVIFDPTEFLRSAEELEEKLPLVEWSRSFKGIQDISKVFFNLCVTGKLKCFEHELLKAELHGLMEVHKASGFRIDHSKGSFSDHTLAIAMAAREAINKTGDSCIKQMKDSHDKLTIMIENPNNIAAYPDRSTAQNNFTNNLLIDL